MKNLNIERFIWMLAGVSILAWSILAPIYSVRYSDAWGMLKLVPEVVTIDVLFFGLFAKWIWKWPPLQGWLVPFPDLNGTWQGKVRSTWTNPVTGKALDPIPCVLVIKQSFTSIACNVHTFTEESSSYGYSAAFLLDEDRNTKQLIYTYTNKPKTSVRHRSPIHDGTALLRVIEKPERMLQGEYWTNRNTTGEIELTFRSKELLEKFPDDLKPASPDSPS